MPELVLLHGQVGQVQPDRQHPLNGGFRAGVGGVGPTWAAGPNLVVKVPLTSLLQVFEVRHGLGLAAH
jgi:hypothetical protein